jgi:hypothetical protein
LIAALRTTCRGLPRRQNPSGIAAYRQDQRAGNVRRRSKTTFPIDTRHESSNSLLRRLKCGLPITIYNRFIRWSRLSVFDKIFEAPAASRISCDRCHHPKTHRTAVSPFKTSCSATYRTRTPNSTPSATERDSYSSCC